MTTITALSAPASAANTGIARTFSRAANTGTSLIAWMQHTAASTNTMTAPLDNNSNVFLEDYTASDSLFTEGVRFYRRTNIANAPTSYTPQASVATGAYGGLIEVDGMDNTAPYVGTSYATDNTPTNHSIAFTTTTPNAIVVVGIRSGSDFSTISALAAGWVDVGLIRNGTKMFYNPDCGAAGAKTLTFTSSTNGGSSHYYFSEYKSTVTDPTVSTVSSPTATEGSPLAFLITLSGATNRSTTYAYTLTGTATSADYTSTITTAMCDNSVTVSGASGSGGTFTVPSGVSSFTVTVPTTPDTIDEADETVILNLPGSVSGTGTISDNDAPPVVTFSDGVESFGVVTCVATLGAVSGKDVTFDVSTANGSKTAGTHYTALSAVPVTIPAGSLTAAITVSTL